MNERSGLRTYDEVAKILNLSKDQVRHSEYKAFRKIRSGMQRAAESEICDWTAAEELLTKHKDGWYEKRSQKTSKK